MLAVVAKGDGASRGREDGGVDLRGLACGAAVDFSVEFDGKPFAVAAELVPKVPVLHAAGGLGVHAVSPHAGQLLHVEREGGGLDGG